MCFTQLDICIFVRKSDRSRCDTIGSIDLLSDSEEDSFVNSSILSKTPDQGNCISECVYIRIKSIKKIITVVIFDLKKSCGELQKQLKNFILPYLV